jgi:ATP-dependent Lhr-like helicase
MAAFDRLHPALVHQVVNALGWRSLRPVQELAIAAAEDGSNLLILAPTAGGKTEAAFFPLISRALAEPWDGLAVLYVSPTKALLNNQQERLERYYGLVGRQAAVWHGDVPAATKRRLLAEPPDCLLTTPESLEGMLVSGSVRPDRLFAGVRAVVVDEVHAFARDDRGCHLLALLQRIGRLAGRDLQRIGLSATVGNEVELLEWLSAGSARSRRVIRPPGGPSRSPRSCSITSAVWTTPPRSLPRSTGARSGWSSATAGRGSSGWPPTSGCGVSRRSSRTARWGSTSGGRPSAHSPGAAIA